MQWRQPRHSATTAAKADTAAALSTCRDFSAVDFCIQAYSTAHHRWLSGGSGIDHTVAEFIG
jgi:hypothetical protein